MPSTQILEMARKSVELREKLTEAKAIYDEAKQEKEDLELNLFQQMESESVQNFKIEGLGTFYKSSKPWSTVTDEEKADAYFKKQGIYDEVFQIKPKIGRINEYIKETFIKNRISMPEDEMGVSVKLTPTIGLRRGK